MRVVEICAGGGGQASGLEAAGFEHAAALEIDAMACETLRLNRPSWTVLQTDIRETNGADYRGIDLLAGGVPCPPFSVAGKQLGADDERDLFPTALRLVREARPRAVLLENVPGFASAKFEAYRNDVLQQFTRMKYRVGWRVILASDFGCAQLRPRFVLVAYRSRRTFVWPTPIGKPPTVGEALVDLMAAGGWRGASAWVERACGVGPTLVGGSKKHGGADLGPSRAKAQWAKLGVEGLSLADAAPGPDFVGTPRLTVAMAARLQGFSDDWRFAGKKTAAYRQVGNAFPPPIAKAVGEAIRAVLAG